MVGLTIRDATMKYDEIHYDTMAYTTIRVLYICARRWNAKSHVERDFSLLGEVRRQAVIRRDST